MSSANNSPSQPSGGDDVAARLARIMGHAAAAPSASTATHTGTMGASSQTATVEQGGEFFCSLSLGLSMSPAFTVAARGGSA